MVISSQILPGYTAKSIGIILLIFMLFNIKPVLAADIDQGERLHSENCTSCHSSTIYTRENRIVNSFRELKERIRQCELSNDLVWFDEEIEAVATYLNKNYYLFEK